MKLFTGIASLLLFSYSYAQTLPIDFETAVTTNDFINFDGGTATVIANPQQNGSNTSSKVAQIVRNGGTIWSGSKIILSNNLDLSTNGLMRMKVFTEAPVGTIVKFKLEGGSVFELDKPTTVTNQWETLEWDFTGVPGNFNTLVFMFDFGNVGNGLATSTFLFDDIELKFGGAQLDLPVNFEGTGINYALTDFGGNLSSLSTDPDNPANTVAKVTKTATAELWAGTTIGTPRGFATAIPLTLADSIMTVRVWSPTAGTPVRLKVENALNPTQTCETQTNTTVAGAWEVLTFDFTNEAPNTAKLSTGIANGWRYDMASIFFNFGTSGAAAGEQTYYFDDVAFGESITGFENAPMVTTTIYPNPTRHAWAIAASANITEVVVFDVMGRRVLTQAADSEQVIVDGSRLAGGVYFARLVTEAGGITISLVKE